jgi:murein DD-endopeptidase MepM/ murein hydrolase activator NlpD
MLRGQVGPALSISIASRAVVPGELIVISVDAPDDQQAVSARAFDRPLAAYRVNGVRWQVLAGIDLDTPPGTYPITIVSGAEHVTRDLVVVRKTFPTRRLTVDENFVTPPPSAAERIAADARLLEATWHASSPERLWAARFRRPVPQPANSAFGTRSVFNGKPRNAHGGADFLSPAGTPIHAPNAGRVLVARDLFYSGNTIVIDHGQGVFSMLAHLSAFDVQEGDTAVAGQVLGRVGATGRVTGPHLHWAMRVNGARVDPLSVLALLGTP